MKKKVFIVSLSILSASFVAMSLSVWQKVISIKADEGIVRHHITMDASNRTNVSMVMDDGDYKYYFDLVSETDNHNEYVSNQYGCYVVVYDQSCADMNSNSYICRISAESGYDNKCVLNLSLNCRSDFKIDAGLIGVSPDTPKVSAFVEYNDDGNIVEEDFKNMNYDVGMGVTDYFLMGGTSLTLHSVSIYYSCTY